MSFDSKKQRKILGHFATGVTVVTTDGIAGLHGMTANAVASLSLDPPLVLVAVDKRAFTLDHLKTESLLRGQHPSARPGRAIAPLCRAGAKGLFGSEDFAVAVTSSPILPGCLAFLDCTVVDILPGGDHEIFIGQIVAGEHHGGEPLLYYSGGYRRLAEP